MIGLRFTQPSSVLPCCMKKERRNLFGTVVVSEKERSVTSEFAVDSRRHRQRHDERREKPTQRECFTYNKQQTDTTAECSNQEGVPTLWRSLEA
jgi:hypothetical protein